MAKRRSRELDEFHAKVVNLLRKRHADWSEWEEIFLLDNAQRPPDFLYSEAQWAILLRLIEYSKTYKSYNGYSIQELLAIAYPFRVDLDEDAQEFLETLHRWKATELKRRQIRRLAAIARNFANVGRDDLDRVEAEQEDPALDAA
ncbi:MAG: hypothetical protein WDO17_25015 [Alphaproteobacteria bacterium]